MTDPWNPSQPGQQPPPTGYGYPPTQYTTWMPVGDGPPGRTRPTGTTILLCVVTLGIYVFIYNYQVHDEMKRHSHRGLGGGIALLLTFIANVAMPFVTPSEVGNLYVRKNQKPPVSGWTGLWFLVPSVGGYLISLILLIAGASGTSSSGSDDEAFGIAVIVTFTVYFAAVIAGGIIWFIKTNSALNTYWETLGRGGFSAATPTP